MASRYLATVRRAMFTPSAVSSETMRSSERISTRFFILDHFADAVAHRFGAVRFGAVHRLDRGGEEIFEFEHAARRGDIFVGGDAADRRFMHRDRVGDGAQIERPQMAHAIGEEAVLLAHDLAGHFQDGAGALVQALDQPVGVVEAVGEIVLGILVARALGDLGVIARS